MDGDWSKDKIQNLFFVSTRTGTQTHSGLELNVALQFILKENRLGCGYGIWGVEEDLGQWQVFEFRLFCGTIINKRKYGMPQKHANLVMSSIKACWI